MEDIEQDVRKQRIIIAGGNGLIGTACRMSLSAAGYDVTVLSRGRSRDTYTVSWDPATQSIADNVTDGAHAVINLCGQSLADGRWTARRKTQLLQSRVQPAQFLSTLIGDAAHPPACYFGMSAIGIYGHTGDTPLSEHSARAASGFIPGLVQAWEDAHRSVVCRQHFILRTGVVLTAGGGFLAKVLPPTRFGVFPYFGDGRQLLSWVHLDDLVAMIILMLEGQLSAGVYHVTAPGTVSYRMLMDTLRRVSARRGMLFGVPRMMMRAGLGEMATMLFESCNVQPVKMQEAGFRFRYPDVESALRAELKVT